MNWRESFPYFRHHPELIYLDSAATAHKPDSVIEALVHFYSQDYATVHRAAYQGAVRATELYYTARERIARFLNAKAAEEIVFTRGTTDSINLVARTFPFQPGDEILLSELEHHSNLVPWQMVAKEKNLILKWIKMLPNGELDLSQPFSHRTKLVAVTAISNVTGTVTPLDAIAKEARRVGAALLVDGAQAAPHRKIDVQALGIDFYAFSGHKCYGPTGIGVLYGKQERLAAMQPLDGGGDMVQRVEWTEATFQEPPLRFEAGTPIIGSAIGLLAAIEFLEEIGLDRITAHEEKLLRFATAELQEIEGLRILGTAPNKGPVMTFTIEGVHPLDIAYCLDGKNIAIRSGNLCAQPLLRLFGCETAARASFALYNTEAEVERFVDAVKHAVGVLT